ncbi:MAG TPA: histidinol-phosphatase [Vicinamibacteria bacterium]|nr:histidinol-phosphatase [Vicinamibacteria bacterium]
MEIVTRSTREYLDFAIEAAFRAGRLVLSHFQTGLQVDRKADDSPVTLADREGERLLRKLISERFPRHAVVGEEMGVASSDSSHRWILDPIDGTVSFVHGVPLFGVLIGLEIGGEPVVGVCYLPALDEMLSAARGEGCRWNGREARVSSIRELREALVCLTEPGSLDGAHRFFWERLKRNARLIRGYSDCYGHCLVATGRAEIMLDPVMNLWDCAALAPIVEEAGGTFTDWRGRHAIDSGNAISTNGALLSEVMALIEDAGGS